MRLVHVRNARRIPRYQTAKGRRDRKGKRAGQRERPPARWSAGRPPAGRRRHRQHRPYLNILKGRLGAELHRVQAHGHGKVRGHVLVKPEPGRGHDLVDPSLVARHLGRSVGRHDKKKKCGKEKKRWSRVVREKMIEKSVQFINSSLKYCIDLQFSDLLVARLRSWYTWKSSLKQH